MQAFAQQSENELAIVNSGKAGKLLEMIFNSLLQPYTLLKVQVVQSLMLRAACWAPDLLVGTHGVC